MVLITLKPSDCLLNCKQPNSLSGWLVKLWMLEEKPINFVKKIGQISNKKYLVVHEHWQNTKYYFKLIRPTY